MVLMFTIAINLVFRIFAPYLAIAEIVIVVYAVRVSGRRRNAQKIFGEHYAIYYVDIALTLIVLSMMIYVAVAFIRLWRENVLYSSIVTSGKVEDCSVFATGSNEEIDIDKCRNSTANKLRAYAERYPGNVIYEISDCVGSKEEASCVNAFIRFQLTDGKVEDCSSFAIGKAPKKYFSQCREAFAAKLGAYAEKDQGGLIYNAKGCVGSTEEASCITTFVRNTTNPNLCALISNADQQQDCISSYGHLRQLSCNQFTSNIDSCLLENAENANASLLSRLSYGEIEENYAISEIVNNCSTLPKGVEYTCIVAALAINANKALCADLTGDTRKDCETTAQGYARIGN